MPTFRNTLPADARPDNLKIKRVPPRGNLQGIALSPDLTIVDTHYWHGRTCPCEREMNAEGYTIDDSACEPCQQKQGYRPHVYVVLWDPRSQSRFLLEVTTQAAKPLAEYIEAHGSLRGANLYAWRPKGTPNGAVVITASPVNQTITRLPAAPDVLAALAILWRLPTQSFTPTAALTDPTRFDPPYGVPVTRLTPHADTLAAVHNQPDNAGGILPKTPEPPRPGGKASQTAEKHRFPPNIRNTTRRTNEKSCHEHEPQTVGQILSGNGKTK